MDVMAIAVAATSTSDSFVDAVVRSLAMVAPISYFELR